MGTTNIDASADRKRGVMGKLALGLLVVLLSLSLCGCHHSTNSSPSKSTKQQSPSTQAEDQYQKERQRELEQEQRRREEEMRRLEESTPEAIADRLGIPQFQLWYNAGQHVGETCTVAGPVVNVHQAKDANGMPIFIDIGAPYPSDNRVTLVVWGEHYDDFAQMINAVDDDDAWLSVTSYLDVYEGSLQMNSDNGCEFTWWTGVE